MTPYEPRHEKTCLGTDHFLGGGGGGGAVFFPSKFSFSSDRKTEIFFSQSESQNIFFQDKAKTIFFFQTAYIYTFVYFLNPIYMGILFICSCIYVSWIFGSECI